MAMLINFGQVCSSDDSYARYSMIPYSLIKYVLYFAAACVLHPCCVTDNVRKYFAHMLLYRTRTQRRHVSSQNKQPAWQIGYPSTCLKCASQQNGRPAWSCLLVCLSKGTAMIVVSLPSSTWSVWVRESKICFMLYQEPYWLDCQSCNATWAYNAYSIIVNLMVMK